MGADSCTNTQLLSRNGRTMAPMSAEVFFQELLSCFFSTKFQLPSSVVLLENQPIHIESLMRRLFVKYSPGRYSRYVQSVESLRTRRECGACAARPACNSGPASSLSCLRTPFVRIKLR
ncbi:hypothetical protein Y032_0033g2783 [Ancylostoma ceylanicum]|uniref:Uncharacterized protein n=1 Tax=Ancylostoma ceylanicum TaxID=53326 RepID=A0A016UNC6_9BILA|nr:hypothetical protein Y032_0033g2783 [Ancylostoma ceylanicum]